MCQDILPIGEIVSGLIRKSIDPMNLRQIAVLDSRLKNEMPE